jgi:hypothetical protein
MLALTETDMAKGSESDIDGNTDMVKGSESDIGGNTDMTNSKTDRRKHRYGEGFRE